MKVLIVGGTGVISTAVVNEAVKQGIDVTCINRGRNHGVAPNPMVNTMHFDVRNRNIADLHLNGNHYDVVVDFICFNADHVKYSLDLFHDKCDQYVFISTDSVYKLQENGHYTETTPQSNPEWNYSYQKAECELLVKDICKTHNLRYTIVRPSITYGNTRIPYGFMPQYGYHYTFVERIKAGKPIITWNMGENWQTMIRIEDFAVGMVGLWGNPKAFNEDFNICGDAYKWKDVLDIIDEHIGIKANRKDIPVQDIIKAFPSKRGEFLIDRAEDHIVSNLKLKTVVPSFTVKINLKDGVNETMSYYDSHNNVLGFDYVYDGQCDRLLALFGDNNNHFINYDGKKCLIHYHDYIIGRYGNNLFIRLLIKVEIVGNRILKKIFKK